MDANQEREPEATPDKADWNFSDEEREQAENLLRMAGLSPSEFFVKFEFVDDVINALLAKLQPGFHIFKASVPGEDTLIIAKKNMMEALVSTNLSSFATHIAVSIMTRPIFVLQLRTFFDGGEATLESINTDVPQEIRGWFVVNGTLMPMNSQQIIDFHCTDFDTGSLVEPERNLAFRDAWILADGSTAS